MLDGPTPPALLRNWQRHRKAIALLAKVLVVAIPIILLVRGERFDLGRQIAVLYDPALLGLLFCTWAMSFVILVAWRWRIVAKMLDLDLPLGFAIKAHSSGVFMSSWLPGGIGGDVWKAYRFGVMVGNTGDQSTAYLSVILDRIIGLYVLVLVGSVCVLADLGRWLASEFGALAIMLLVLCLALSVAGFLILLSSFPLPAWFSGFVDGMKSRSNIVRMLVDHIGSIRRNRTLLFQSLSMSVLIQIVNVLFFVMIAKSVTGQPVDFITMSGIFTISLLITILSMAPGGLGVGHLMFDVLFGNFGLPNGADVFNVFFVVTTLFSLIGVATYLWPESTDDNHPR